MTEPASKTAARIGRIRYGWRRSRGTADSKVSSRRPAGSAHGLTGGSWYALCGRYERRRLIIADASASDAAIRSTAALRACTPDPPSSSLPAFSPVPLLTTGGPATNSWAVPSTRIDRWAMQSRAAPRPATGPSPAATTGTQDRLSTT